MSVIESLAEITNAYANAKPTTERSVAEVAAKYIELTRSAFQMRYGDGEGEDGVKEKLWGALRLAVEGALEYDRTGQLPAQILELHAQATAPRLLLHEDGHLHVVRGSLAGLSGRLLADNEVIYTFVDRGGGVDLVADRPRNTWDAITVKRFLVQEDPPEGPLDSKTYHYPKSTVRP